jgi:hypothetical protein
MPQKYYNINKIKMVVGNIIIDRLAASCGDAGRVNRRNLAGKENKCAEITGKPRESAVSWK